MSFVSDFVKQATLVSINGYYLDVILSETHTFENEVTEYPVESGAMITDNVRPKPVVITMECLVSDTPIGTVATLRSKDSPATADAYALLLKIRDDREPVPIVTTLQSYDSMVLKNVTIPRSSGRGAELRFTATFQEIQIVSNKRFTRVATPIARKDGGGNKPPKTYSNDKFFKIVRRVGGWIWFDTHINGWRYGAQIITQFGVTHTGPTSSGPGWVPGSWLFSDGRIYGFTAQEWEFEKRPVQVAARNSKGNAEDRILKDQIERGRTDEFKGIRSDRFNPFGNATALADRDGHREIQMVLGERTGILQ